jgi:protein-S-isoprenylcysteine O-methyltransferase Ste14
MPDYWFPKPYADAVARLRVTAGFVLVAAFGIFSKPTFYSLEIGLPISLVGILLRGWAAGHLRKNQRLATGGPYAHTRNPLYIGTLIVAAGLVAASRSVWLAALFALVFLLIYLPVIELEEQHLRKLFPDYADYAREVPRLVPRLSSGGRGGRFEFSVYWRNQEYQALAGFLAGAALLIWKAVSH